MVTLQRILQCIFGYARLFRSPQGGSFDSKIIARLDRPASVTLKTSAKLFLSLGFLPTLPSPCHFPKRSEVNFFSLRGSSALTSHVNLGFGIRKYVRLAHDPSLFSLCLHASSSPASMSIVLGQNQSAQANSCRRQHLTKMVTVTFFPRAEPVVCLG